jgi:hypothetical protein
MPLRPVLLLLAATCAGAFCRHVRCEMVLLRELLGEGGVEDREGGHVGVAVHPALMRHEIEPVVFEGVFVVELAVELGFERVFFEVRTTG